MSNIPILLAVSSGSNHQKVVAEFVEDKFGVGEVASQVDWHLVNQIEEEVVQSIQIDDARELPGKFLQRPVRGIGELKQAFFVFYNLDAASLPAQHALLKSLEEPPEHVQCIVTVENLSGVLPTVQSRCLVIEGVGKGSEVESGGAAAIGELLADLKTGGATKVFAFSETYKDRDRAKEFLRDLLLYLHHQNTVHPTLHLTQQLHATLRAQAYLSHNVSVRLVLEDLLFTL